MEKKHKQVICLIIAALSNVGMTVNVEAQPLWLWQIIVRIAFTAFVFFFAWYVLFENNSAVKSK